jgi:hypothetical protein
MVIFGEETTAAQYQERTKYNFPVCGFVKVFWLKGFLQEIMWEKRPPRLKIKRQKLCS